MTAWWPQITVDVIASDLTSFGKTQIARGLQKKQMDEDEVSEWSLKRDERIPEKSEYSKFDLFRQTLALKQRLIDRLRFDTSMACFHSLANVVALNGNYPQDPISPLDFCQVSSAYAQYPSAALDLDQYVSMLTDIDVVCVCIENEVRTHTLSSAQDVKDLQRDSICINGRDFSGAETGYGGIMNFLNQIVGNRTDSEFALSIANRTFSGGVAFDLVLSRFHADRIVSIAPLSAEAEPLDIVVAPSSGVLIRAQTNYSLIPELSGKKLSFVRATTLVEIPIDQPVANARGACMTGWVPAKVTRGTSILASSSEEEEAGEQQRGSRRRSTSRLRELVTALDENIDGDKIQMKRLTLEFSSGSHALISLVHQARVRILASTLRHWLTKPVFVRTGAARSKQVALLREMQLMQAVARVASSLSRSCTMNGLREFLFRLKWMRTAETEYKISLETTSRNLKRLMGFYIVTSLVDKVVQRNVFSSYHFLALLPRKPID